MTSIFLDNWITEALKSKQLFDAQNFSQAQLDEQAIYYGYRTGKIWVTAMNDHLAALKYFKNAKPFKELWNILKKQDEINGKAFAFSEARGGVPNRLLESLNSWHNLPKFTPVERKNHSKKIAKACELLQDLLGQVLPNENYDSQYSRFTFIEDGQAEAVFRVFKSKPKLGARFEASHRLALCGVTPIWAIDNIRTNAEAEISHSSLVKVHAKTAKKTYLIPAVISAINSALLFGNAESIGITNRLIADIVGLLSGMDCEIDDVRKLMTKQEDFH